MTTENQNQTAIAGQNGDTKSITKPVAKQWFRVFDGSTLAHICDMTLASENDAYDPRIGGSGNIVVQPIDAPVSFAPRGDLAFPSFRWEGDVREVHQTGAVLGGAKGVNVKLLAKDEAPGELFGAEVFSDDCSQYAEIGLSFDGRTLVDYDGAFDLPPHLAALLLANGYELGDMVEGEDLAEVLALRALIGGLPV